MTATQPDRLYRIEASVERMAEAITSMDKKFDAIATDLVEIKVTQAKMDERFNSIDKRFDQVEQRLGTLENRVETGFKELRGEIKSTDSRLWGFISALLVVLLGILGKVFLFPKL